MENNLKTFPKVDGRGPVGYQWECVAWRRAFEAELKAKIIEITRLNYDNCLHCKGMVLGFKEILGKEE